MKCYIVNESLNESIVGNDYPQAYKFIKGYDPEAPNAIFSMYNYRSTFPDYIPELDGIMLSGSAKLTDFVSQGFSSNFHIVSEKAKTILEKHRLCSHQFYPLGLYKRKIKQSYYLFKPISDYLDFIDYKKTAFVEYNISTGEKVETNEVTSKEKILEINNKLENQKDISWCIWGDKIVMSKYFDNKLDYFKIGRIDSNIYVSERLKNEIESNDLTGWEFTPATNLIVED